MGRLTSFLIPSVAALGAGGARAAQIVFETVEAPAEQIGTDCAALCFNVQMFFEDPTRSVEIQSIQFDIAIAEGGIPANLPVPPASSDQAADGNLELAPWNLSATVGKSPHAGFDALVVNAATQPFTLNSVQAQFDASCDAGNCPFTAAALASSRIYLGRFNATLTSTDPSFRIGGIYGDGAAISELRAFHTPGYADPTGDADLRALQFDLEVVGTQSLSLNPDPTGPRFLRPNTLRSGEEVPDLVEFPFDLGEDIGDPEGSIDVRVVHVSNDLFDINGLWQQILSHPTCVEGPCTIQDEGLENDRLYLGSFFLDSDGSPVYLRVSSIFGESDDQPQEGIDPVIAGLRAAASTGSCYPACRIAGSVPEPRGALLVLLAGCAIALRRSLRRAAPATPLV